jgi:hypothetical protein
MKRVKKSKSVMTSSEEYTEVNIFKQESLLFERGCHPFYEGRGLSLSFRKQNGENQDKRENYQENTLRSSATDILIGQRGKRRENYIRDKSNLDGQKRQKSASGTVLKPENRRKLSSSYSVEFTRVSGLSGRGPHPLPF